MPTAILSLLVAAGAAEIHSAARAGDSTEGEQLTGGSISTPVGVSWYYPSQLPYGDDVRVYGLQFNLLYGRVDTVYGINVGTGINTIDDALRGIQLAGLGRQEARDVLGLQLIGCGINKTSLLRGIQYTAIGGNSAGEMRGLQSSLFGVNVAERNMSGWQDSCIGNGVFGDMHGLQSALLTSSVDGNVFGAQLSGIHNYAGEDLAGFQLGMLNVVHSTARGIQFGVVNSCKRLAGLQIGLANFVTDSRLPLVPGVNARFGAAPSDAAPARPSRVVRMDEPSQVAHPDRPSQTVSSDEPSRTVPADEWPRWRVGGSVGLNIGGDVTASYFAPGVQVAYQITPYWSVELAASRLSDSAHVSESGISVDVDLDMPSILLSDRLSTSCTEPLTVYATGGIGYFMPDIDVDVDMSEFLEATGFRGPTPRVSAGAPAAFGFLIGLGAEWALTSWLEARIEYRYTFLELDATMLISGKRNAPVVGQVPLVVHQDLAKLAPQTDKFLYPHA